MLGAVGGIYQFFQFIMTFLVGFFSEKLFYKHVIQKIKEKESKMKRLPISGELWIYVKNKTLKAKDKNNSKDSSFNRSKLYKDEEDKINEESKHFNELPEIKRGYGAPIYG